MYKAIAQEMERLDALAVESGLEIEQMMELAGYHMLSVFQERGYTTEGKVAVVVGKGNKGGDGVAAARHLVNYGYEVDIVLVSREVSQD